jgi:rod shape-determining protein MreD
MNRTWIAYGWPILIFFAALFQATAATRLRLLGVKPDLVLLLVLVGALMYGARLGLAWAFWGGICLDLYGGPMGASSIALLLAAAVAAISHDLLSRSNLLVPLGVAAIGTFVYCLAYMGVLEMLASLSSIVFLQPYNLPNLRLPFDATLRSIVLPSLFYNTGLMLLAAPFLNRSAGFSQR